MGTSVLLVFLAPLMSLFAALSGVFDLLGINAFEQFSQWIAENSEKIIELQIKGMYGLEIAFGMLYSMIFG